MLLFFKIQNNQRKCSIGPFVKGFAEGEFRGEDKELLAANGCHKDPYPPLQTNVNLHYRSFLVFCVFEWGASLFFNRIEKPNIL